MYLSRLMLNPTSRQVRSEISNPYEMHRTVMKAFAGHLQPDERVLFRLEIHPRSGLPTLLVQSHHEPDWEFLTDAGQTYLLFEHDAESRENPAVKKFDLQLTPGQMLRFRLRANPSIKKDRPGQKQGRRVGLYHEEEQLKWLEHKISEAGGRLISTQMLPGDMLEGCLYRQDQKLNLSILAVQFEGILEIKDPSHLEKTIQAGIGSGKGLGLGLLSVARA